MIGASQIRTVLRNPSLATRFIKSKAIGNIPIKTYKTLGINGYSAEFIISTSAEYSHYKGNFKSEKDIIKDCLQNTSSKDVFYDIGANIGLYSCLIGQTGAKIIPFEPQPENAKRCDENLKMNDLEPNTREIALSEEDRKVTLEIEDRGLMSGAGRSQISSNGAEGITVETRRVDKLVRNNDIDQPSVVKIDVEGAEMSVIRGFGDVLEGVDTLYCEIHECYNVDKKEIDKYLQNYGFGNTTISKRTGEKLVRYQ